MKRPRADGSKIKEPLEEKENEHGLPTFDEMLGGKPAKKKKKSSKAGSKSRRKHRRLWEPTIIDRMRPPALFPNVEYSYKECFFVETKSEDYEMLCEWVLIWENAAKHHHYSVKVSRLCLKVNSNLNSVFNIPKGQVYRRLLKIMVVNRHGEPTGLEAQFVAIGLRFSKFWCFSRGDDWGGWEFYNTGCNKPTQRYCYSKKNPPHKVWKDVMWIQGMSPSSGTFNHPKNLLKPTDPPDKPLYLFPSDIERMLGATMKCAQCDNRALVCIENSKTIKIGGPMPCESFHGRFTTQDLFDRHVELINTPTLAMRDELVKTISAQKAQDRELAKIEKEIVKQMVEGCKESPSNPNLKSPRGSPSNSSNGPVPING